MNRTLKRIAIDLTPILRGGENGGAKIFALELVERLAEIEPELELVLLTQADTHEELATLDRANVRRVTVVANTVARTARRRLLAKFADIFSFIPHRVRGAIIHMALLLDGISRRNSAGSLLRGMGVDLLFCPFTAPTYYEPGIPVVCTVHDLQYKTYPEFFSPEEIAHRNKAFMEACRRASMLAAVSDYSRGSAILHGKVDPERIRTIYHRLARLNAVYPVPNRRVILDGLGLQQGRYLVYPANFWKHKNHEMLLAAFGISHRIGMPGDIKLVCTGAPGARRDWLQSAARNMGQNDRVVFPGYLAEDELVELIANSGGIIFPSLYEGFGLPVIEAMAAGVPVACSKVASLPEIAGDAAIYFDPRIPQQLAQAMIQLVAGDKGAREKLMMAGRQRAEVFGDTNRMAQEYLNLFQAAVNQADQVNALAGAYADGWIGSSMNVHVAPAQGAKSLELEFLAPGWLSQPYSIVQVRRQGKLMGTSLKISRGKKAVWSTQLDTAGGLYEIKVAPTFVPAHSGQGDDTRELSIMLQRCSISKLSGECVELFRNQNSL